MSYVSAEGVLGIWISQQRCAKRQNTLRSDREVLLQEVVDEGKLYWEPLNVRIDG